MAHLLIVDNDERIVELTSWFLERSGHRVDTALTYAAARERIAAGLPDLMLADLDLGEEQGREELPRLSADGLLPRTIVVSGFLDADLERELLRIPGVLGSLTKPVDLASLEELIDESLSASLEGESAATFTLPTQSGLSTQSGLPTKSGLPTQSSAEAATPPIRDADGGGADAADRPVDSQPSSESADDEEAGWVEIVPLSPDVPPTSTS